MKIDFQKQARTMTVRWQHVPRIGDSVSIRSKEKANYDEELIGGVVSNVIWWTGSWVRVLLRDE